MIRDVPQHPAAPLEGSDDPFRIVSIFDGSAASQEAARASAIVMRELGEEVAIDRSSWDIQSLEATDTCDFAAREAARADMIVIALSERAPSQLLKNWVELWERKRKIEGGLLALIPSGKEQGDLREFLSETAITANMDFLCQKKPRFK